MTPLTLFSDVTASREASQAHKVIILGSSLGSSTQLWDLALPTLSAHYTVIRCDLPGHGQSPVSESSFSISDLADAVIAVADSHGVTEFDYAGVSVSGAIAQDLAYRYPERLRLHATSPYIGRTTSKPTTISGVQLGAGEKVLLLLGAANLDGSPEDKLDVFDINRSSRRHLTFGFGVHSCVGQMFARLEGVSILTAIAEQLSTLEITGEPVLKYSNWLRGFESLPMRVS